MWSRQSDRADLHDILIKPLVSADPDILPNIRILMLSGCNLPAIPAEAQRSFFVLRLIKAI